MRPIFIPAIVALSVKHDRGIPRSRRPLLRDLASDQLAIGYALVGASIILLVGVAVWAMVG